MTRFRTKIGLWCASLAVAITCAAFPGLAQPGKLQLDNLDKLSAKASVVNDVSLDGALLGLATKAVESTNDPDAREVKEAVRGLKGIYIKNFEFDKPHQYSPEDVEAIRAQLARGWVRIVQSHDKRQDALNEIYLLKEGDKVAGITILVAEPNELTVVNIVGAIDLDKLGSLAGKLGIPDQIKNETQKPKSKTAPPVKPEQKETPHNDEQDLYEQ